MEIRVLGPLEVVEDGRTIAIASERQRALLALLVLHAGHPVSTDRILDALWGEAPPESRAGSVAFHVSRLRATLEPARRAGDGAGDGVIATVTGGYALRLSPDSVDATRCDRLAREGHALLADDPATASDRLAQALRAWRGEPFEDLGDLPFLQPEIVRLRALRLRLIEDRFEAELALGHGSAVIGELEAMVAEEPLREHLRAQLMRALYGAGRQADALRVFQDGRRFLSDELGIDPSPELQALELAILRQDPSLEATRGTVGPRNPYKGLRPFSESDVADFFGREASAARLVERLDAVSRAGGLLLVVGPSGSGKSSVVRAGLLPLLRARAAERGGSWRIATMLPGSRPEEALLRALASVVPDPAALPAEAVSDADAIAETVHRAAAADPRALLIVVDQLEELFALAVDPDAPARFLHGLVAALRGPSPRPTVVAMLRADWFDRLLISAELGALVRDGTEVVTPLTRDEVERAIVRPASAVGVQLEAGLAADLEADVIDRPGALPLLQFALTELFERAGGRSLTRESYAAIGGIAGAVGRRAEAVFAELEPASRVVARQVFLRLVAVGERRTVTACRVLLDELRSIDPEPTRIDEVLDAFGGWRLLAFDREARTGRATVEPAHEALLTHWPRLAGWIEEAREALWIEARLKDAAGEWATAGRDAGFLLAGSRLDLFASWAATTDLRLDSLERELLDASLAERRRSEAIEQEQRDRQHRLERRATTWLRALVVVLLVAVVGASGLLVVVWRQAEGARAEREIATGRELAVASTGALDSNPSLALLLGVEAARATADRGGIVEEAMDALHWALQAARVPYPSSATRVAVRASPDRPRGIYLLPAAELVTMAQAAAGRSLTAEECRRFLHSTCPGGGPWVPAPSLAVLSTTGLVEADGLSESTLNGATVRVASQLPTDLAPLLAGFERQSGIDVESVPAGDLTALDDIADVAIIARPDDVATLARGGRLFDLDTLGTTAIREDAPDAALEAGWSGPLGLGREVRAAQRYGFPIAVSLSGLLWYPEAAFREAGYTPPGTWAELQALLSEIRADGGVPWCLGIQDEAGRDDLVDWVEDLVLGAVPIDQYEALADDQLSLDGRPMRDAIVAVDSLLAVDGAVRGGLETASLTPHGIAGLSMRIPTGPTCWLQHGAATLPASWPASVRDGMGMLPMPAPDPTRAGTLRGRVFSVVVLRDRPEVRALVRHLAGGGVDEAIAAAGSGAGLLPLGDVPLSSFAERATRDEYVAFRAALPSGFAVDATDRMPAALATVVLPDRLATYLRSGRGTERAGALDRLLDDLEAARGTLR